MSLIAIDQSWNRTACFDGENFFVTRPTAHKNKNVNPVKRLEELIPRYDYIFYMEPIIANVEIVKIMVQVIAKLQNLRMH